MYNLITRFLHGSKSVTTQTYLNFLEIERCVAKSRQVCDTYVAYDRYIKYPGKIPNVDEVPGKVCRRVCLVRSVSCLGNFMGFMEIAVVSWLALPEDVPFCHCTLHWVQDEEGEAGTTGNAANRVEASAMATTLMHLLQSRWISFLSLFQKRITGNAELCSHKSRNQSLEKRNPKP